MTSVHTILHPTDFSPCANKAFNAACAIARERDAQLVLLHVMEPLRLSGEWITFELFSVPKHERWEALRRLKAREPDLQIEPVVRKGAPAAVILSLASEVSCDLIVMGMTGHGEKEGLLGLVASEVTRLAKCPIIGVKLPSTEEIGPASAEPLAAA